MADDRTPPAEVEPEAEPEAVEDTEEKLKDEDQEDSRTSGSDGDRNCAGNCGEEEGSSGYFSRMFQRKIGGDDLERRIELIDKEEESLESRMIIRGKTAEQVNRSMFFLSVNLEFVAGIYAYLRIRSRNLSWRGRVIRILPMFLIPAIASFFYTFFSRFTSMLNLRDGRLLERLRKEREAKLQELKERANCYMSTKRHIQNCHGESSSMASSLGTNLPEICHTREKTLNPSLSWGKSKQLQLERNSCHDACKPIVIDENRKKKLRSLLICRTCRMHNGFASRDELPSISYKCPHCNALNGPHKEQRNCGSASTSAEGAPQSQPYNPFSIPEMPRGIFIEEITPNHVTTDPEMDAPVMIIRESPTIGGGEGLPSASTPDIFTPKIVWKLPIGLSIEEMASNEVTTNVEMEPPVMIIPESPAAVNPLSVPEMETGLSVEEINSNDHQIEDHETIAPVVFVQEPPLADSQVELPSNRNSATVDPVTVPEFPSGLSIEEMTPNQEMVGSETEPPVMIISESPLAGVPVLGDASFITPLMASGLSIEEVSPNHQLTEAHEINPPIMYVQESPSLGGQELSESTPDPSTRTSVTVPEMPDFFVEELNPNQPGSEDCEMDPPVMIVHDSPSTDGLAAATPLEVLELRDDTINTDGSVRSPDDSANWSTPGSSETTESDTFQEIPEQDQEETNENEMPGSSHNERLQRYLHENADVDGPVKTTAVTAQASLIEPHLQSDYGSGTDDGIDGNYESDSNSWGSFASGPDARSTFTVTEINTEIDEKSQNKSQQINVHKMNVTHPDTNDNLTSSESEANSDYGSFTDVNEEDPTIDVETRVTVSDNSDRVMEENSRNPEGQRELLTSTYDDSMDNNGDFGSSIRNSGFTGSSTVSGDEDQGPEWEQYKELSGPSSRERISDGLNMTTTIQTPVEKTQLIVEEMPPTDTSNAVEELEELQQERPRSSVSENSDSAEESLGHDHPNPVGSVAYDRDKGSTSQNLRKGVGGMKKDRVMKKNNRREGERADEISDKEGSVKKQGTKPKPIMMTSAALLSPNSGLDPQSKPFTGIISDPAPQWSTSTDFEPASGVGLRHRK